MKPIGVFSTPPSKQIFKYSLIQLAGERHCESKVSCPRSQPSVSGQDWNLDRLILPWGHHVSYIGMHVFFLKKVMFTTHEVNQQPFLYFTVCLKWRLHFEFTLASSPLPAGASPVQLTIPYTDIATWQGPPDVEAETMTWDLPVKIIATNPLHASSISMHRTSSTMIF